MKPFMVANRRGEVAAALGSQVRGQLDGPPRPPTGLPAVSKFYYLYGHTVEQASIDHAWGFSLRAKFSYINKMIYFFASLQSSKSRSVRGD